ncbi:MAG TPA: AAA family ATPase [Humisphaera sp.]|jgi:exonuclease SbcC|nr:AAA family ATPase [Humisphaera sp.]
MITRITLINYMSHAHTVIEPVLGLTALVGPNNCGKSAIVHALETLCYNRPAAYAVRHGQKESSVTVETHDGHAVTWRRRGDAVSYVIDGREIDRLGGGVPEDLHQILKMPPITSASGNGDFFVHFGLQKSPIFLLDDSPARAATFFASSSDAEKLLAMQRLHRENVQQARREQRNLIDDLSAVEARLEALEPVNEISSELERLEEQFAAVRAAESTIESAARHARQWHQVERRRKHHFRSVEILETVPRPPQLDDEIGLSAQIRKLRDGRAKVDRQGGRAHVLADLKEAPSQLSEEPLGRMIFELKKAAARSRKTDARRMAIQALQEPPAIADAAPLENAIAKLREQNQRINQTNIALRKISSDIDAIAEQLSEWAAENPVCPVCGGETSVAAMLAGGHAHA